MGKLKCPKCKSTNVQLIASGLNTKQKTSINLNPLNLTVFNHKQKAKRSILGGKKKTREFQCSSCGKTWMEK
ncbi:hypothetical protein SAMN04487821_14818 [Enterococcus malodoratus]|jgi:hypothetical protein|uniref:hypothetical protein n=1 Tax=Enterococcus malodoratus TaxID=71451 RepID=UPI0008BE2C7E|nr:hypothetical protein [Enterococcus malodoratus]SEU01588.1 hypothetical protein SAMN04487821_14818 [Enterococcus malodoratus]DAM28566.1 MAG TPA: transcription factor IIS-like protein [Caudoviricetes sp.]